MSTIPEVVAAREEGLEVTVLSLVTNKVVIPDKLRSIKEEVKAEVSHHLERSVKFDLMNGLSLLVNPCPSHPLR